MTSSQTEQRQAKRFTYICEARCETPGRLSTDLITTLSATGAWIETSDPPIEGAILILSFAVGSTMITTQARVVHRQPGKGMGVAFQNLRPQHREAIMALSGDTPR